MAIIQVTPWAQNNTAGQNTASLVLTFGSNISAGSKILVLETGFASVASDTGAGSQCTDNHTGGSDTFTSVAEQFGTDNQTFARAFYTAAAASTDVNTITVATTAAFNWYGQGIAIEIGNTVAANPYDANGFAQAGGSSTTMAVGPTSTLTQAANRVFLFGRGNGATPTAPAGWTQLALQVGAFYGHKAVNATTAISGSISISPTDPWAIEIVTIKLGSSEVGGGGAFLFSDIGGGIGGMLTSYKWWEDEWYEGKPAKPRSYNVPFAARVPKIGSTPLIGKHPSRARASARSLMTRVRP